MSYDDARDDKGSSQGSVGDGNENYSDFNASAQPPQNGWQFVVVSGNVMVDNPQAQGTLQQIQQEGASESALVLALRLDPSSAGAGQNPVPVGFKEDVQLEEGNAITQIEIQHDQLGNLTIDLS